MELRHLEQILEICRAGGFSGAARRLEISQPTLSKSIARLETQLSVKLFERNGGAARPTAYGAFVAQRAEALLQGVAALSRDLEQLGPRVYGPCPSSCGTSPCGSRGCTSRPSRRRGRA